MPKLFRRRSVPLPTLAGALLLGFLLGAAALVMLRQLPFFLATDEPVAREILVVEGWLPRDALDLSAQAYRSGGYDTLMVRFFASCADYDVDLGHNNKVIRGDKSNQEWCEDWCFQRSSEATTKVDGGTFAKKCPNCGAPLDVDLAGTCNYCKAPIMGGKFDWVLTRIEQLASWEFGEGTLPR